MIPPASQKAVWSMELAGGLRPVRADRLAGWIVVVAALVHLAGCGSKTPVTPPTPAPPPTTLAPATLADLSAAVTSPEAGVRISCRDDVHAVVSLTNRSPNPVFVSGVRKKSASLSGGCTPARDFTYAVAPRFVSGSTAIVMDRALYLGGSGCCPDPGRCAGTCTFEEAMEVVTELGAVAAGMFSYSVVFSNCVPCESTTSLAARGCPPPAAPR